LKVKEKNIPKKIKKQKRERERWGYRGGNYSTEKKGRKNRVRFMS